jgi:hypothetical protein
MPSITQEDILGVMLGADFLTEPSVDQPMQVSEEESGWFYKIGENTEAHHFSPTRLEFAQNLQDIPISFWKKT